MWRALHSLAKTVVWSDLHNPNCLLLRDIYMAAIAEFGKWNRASGRVLAGLTRRRASEARLWCSFPNYIVPA